ncbi:TPA: sel1 repeat family protein, partial [Aeromonas veronii]|nr:sel1 repeat family protein [Aeromonas veronii]
MKVIWSIELVLLALLTFIQPLQAKDWSKEPLFTLELMAQGGDAEAQFALGIRYVDGSGVAQDYKQAVAWWRKAAEQGDVDAQHNLGVMYYKGEGVAQNTKQAVAWFRKAAEQGNVDAQNNLEQIQKEAQKAEQDRKIDARGDNLYVETREGDAILTDEPCWLDSTKKDATLPSQKMFPKVGLYGCW